MARAVKEHFRRRVEGMGEIDAERMRSFGIIACWWLDEARGSPSHLSVHLVFSPHFGMREGSRLAVLSFGHACEIIRQAHLSTPI